VSDVFVSYKRENLSAVRCLVEALRAEGVGVWWDQDIAPNAAWEATIEQQLTAAKLVIVAWSPAAVASENVKAEARQARQQGRLLQVFVEACEPPLFFGERQGVDLKHWSGLASDTAFRSVLDAVRKGLAPSSVATQDPAGPPVLHQGANLPPLALPTKPSIAVMPFANLSGDPEQEYFADGMVVEVVAALARIRSIFVIASGSSLSFKGKGLGPQEVARQLGVRFVLEGSVRKATNRVRIAVQLIDASDGAQIWTHRFEDTLEDIFALQDMVALAVAGKIEPAVQQAEIRRASARPTANMGSHDLALRALPLWRTVTRAGVLEALDLLNRAVSLDPDYGMALSEAAVCHHMIYINGWSHDSEAVRREGIDLAQRALQVAGDDATVLSYAAIALATLGRDVDAATSLFDRAVALNPGSSIAWLLSGNMRARCGDADLAIEHLETAVRLDPMGPNRPSQNLFMGAARFGQGRFVEAVARLRDYLQQVDGPNAQALLAASYGHLGQAGAASEALDRYRRLTPLLVEEFGRRFFLTPSHLKLFLDGIALAKGEAPSETAAEADTP